MFENVWNLFGIELCWKCKVNNKHYFKTQSDGSDICKTPLEMFEDKEIDNDLKLVDTAIREYYELGKVGK